MADYGDFRYGSTTLYGSGAAVPMPDGTSECIWLLSVDWDNNGSYDGTNEAQWLSELVSFRRGRDHYVSQGGNDFERMQMGKAILRMDNSDRRYDPYNTGSVLYPNVVPGRRAQLAVRYVDTGETFVLLTGFIENIRPVNDDRKHVYIDIVDGWKYLGEGDVTVDTPVYRTTISSCINSVLDVASYPGGRSVDSDSQPIVRWAPEGENASRTLQKLATASLGNVFVNKNGKFCFYSRSHNSQPTHNISQSQILKDIIISMPWENVRNEVTCIANKPFKGELKQIVALPSPLRIVTPSSTWRTFTLEFDREYIDISFEGLLANTREDNSGIWITNVIDYTYSIGAKSITISVSTPVNGYVTDIVLKGREYITRAVKFNASDTSSRVAYGNRRFILDSEYLQNINHAEAFATIIKNELKDPSKAPKFIIQGRPDIQYDFDLLDKVAFESTTLEIDETFYVGSIELRWLKEGGQSVQTILTLTPLIYDTTSIDDDPYDPGLPEVPTLPGLPGGPGSPEPIEVPIDCINDPDAAPNGPFPVFNNGGIVDLFTNSSKQEEVIFPYQTVVRMGESTHVTTVSFKARRTIQIAGIWYTTESESFYEIWAVDNTGAELFQADEVSWDGEWMTAKFHPDDGTVISGIKVKTIIGPEYNFDIGYTFDFESGLQGWIAAPVNPSYPNGWDRATADPCSFREPYQANYWNWNGGSLDTRAEYINWYKPPDKCNVWCFYPNARVYIKSGANFTAQIYSDLSWNAIGVWTKDNVWYFATPATSPVGIASLTLSGGAVGKEVDCFCFHSLNARYQWQKMYYAMISGFTVDPTNTMKLTIYEVYISNVCAV